MIGVKNNGTETLTARYDGKDYSFPPGVTKALSEAAAAHIFGFGLEDKTRVLARLGWASSSAQYAQAIAKLNDFTFLAVEGIKFKDGDTQEGGPNTLHLPSKQQAIQAS